MALREHRWCGARLEPGVLIPLLADLAAAAEGAVVQRDVGDPHEERAHRFQHRPRHSAQVVCICRRRVSRENKKLKYETQGP